MVSNLRPGNIETGKQEKNYLEGFLGSVFDKETLGMWDVALGHN